MFVIKKKSLQLEKLEADWVKGFIGREILTYIRINVCGGVNVVATFVVISLPILSVMYFIPILI